MGRRAARVERQWAEDTTVDAEAERRESSDRNVVGAAVLRPKARACRA